MISRANIFRLPTLLVTAVPTHVSLFIVGFAVVILSNSLVFGRVCIIRILNVPNSIRLKKMQEQMLTLFPSKSPVWANLQFAHSEYKNL